jgi:hypothetical protein
MRTSAFLVLCLACAPVVGQDVRKIDLGGIRRAADSEVGKPREIKDAAGLEAAFKKNSWQGIAEQAARRIDFGKERALFFSWSGSFGDRLEPSVEKGLAGPVAVFTYRRGTVANQCPHHALYVLPKGIRWRVDQPKK